MLNKKTCMIDTLPTVIFELLNSFFEKGVFDDYSERHFSIRALNKDDEFFMRKYNIPCFSETFVMNLFSKMKGLCEYFGADKIEMFFRNQLSAGKSNYREEIFFQALSEIHILIYFIMTGPAIVKKTTYEPCLCNGKTNPEVRFEYEDGTIIDIEVKTPEFVNKDNSRNFFLPTILLNEKSRKELANYCKDNEIECVMPRVLKIKDYINSAGTKFQLDNSEKHYNFLVVNWTYSDFFYSGLIEPVSLLCNSINGLLKKEICNQLNIDIEAIEKISTFLLYQMPIETLLFSDIIFWFRDRSYKVIVNPYAKNTTKEMIHMWTCYPKCENY